MLEYPLRGPAFQVVSNTSPERALKFRRVPHSRQITGHAVYDT